MDVPGMLLEPLFDGYPQSCLNPVEDTDLSAILDDLQEGTLLSLMQDEDLFKEVDGDSLLLPFTAASQDDVELPSETVELEDFLGADMDLDELQVVLDQSESADQQQQPQLVSSGDSSSGRVEFSVGGMPESAIDDETETITLECGKVLTPNLSDASINSSSTGYTLACVQHDHCYTTAAAAAAAKEGSDASLCSKDHGSDASLCSKDHRGSTASEGDVSTDRDEGSSSDTGYDTMSASTSPGNTSSSPEHTPRPATSLPPLSSGLDPVALIDARIQHFMCSQEINLTEEEKETLTTEGLPIPTTLPLTKIEEKALKGVRRKLRNKAAARESRKRKKEQLFDLEDKVDHCNTENLMLKKRVQSLESENRSLLSQLRRLQSVVSGSAGGTGRSKTHVGACLMVLVLCFAIFFGNWSPHRMSAPANAYTTSSVRSRSLLSVDHGPQNFHSMACDWFRHIFMREDSDAGSGERLSARLLPPVFGPQQTPAASSGARGDGRVVTLDTQLSLENNHSKEHIAVKQ